MKRLAPVLACLFAFAVLAAPASANHPWSTYHWARTSSTNFTVKLGDNVNNTWQSFLEQAKNADWQAINGSPVATTIVAGSGDARKCRARAGMVEVCNAAYGRNGWLGLAQIWLSGGHISQGTAKMNDSYYSQAAYNNYGFRALVMCQEVGHTFGLAHQDENHTNANLGSCMDYTNNPMGGGTNGSLKNDHANAHDWAQLGTIYGDHWDSSTTVSASTQASRGSANPFRTHRKDTPGHTEIVEEYADGSALVTDIIWAAER